MHAKDIETLRKTILEQILYSKLKVQYWHPTMNIYSLINKMILINLLSIIKWILRKAKIKLSIFQISFKIGVFPDCLGTKSLSDFF